MIPAEHSHLYVAAITHAGMKGKENEDRYAIAAHQISESDRTPSLLMVVADGVGGHRAGEVASQIAIEQIVQTIGQSNGHAPLDTLRLAINNATQAILDSAEQDQSRQGMGATCICAWVMDDKLYACWLGDSRLYLMRDGVIWQATTDHTWIQEALSHGILTPDQVPGHPNAHVIHRHLGSQNHNEPDFRLRTRPGDEEGAESHQGFRLRGGDRLLLCSDGLTDLVTPEEILKAVSDYPREQALLGLVNLANQRGGHDNITITLGEVPVKQAAASHPSPLPKLNSLHFSLACLGVAVLLILALAAILLMVWWFLYRPVDPTPPPVQETVLYLRAALEVWKPGR
jgi:protein phosphatase